MKKQSLNEVKRLQQLAGLDNYTLYEQSELSTDNTHKIGDLFKVPSKQYIDGKLVDFYSYYMLLPHLTKENIVGLYSINPITLKYQPKYRKMWGTTQVNDPNSITQEEFEKMRGESKYGPDKDFGMVKMDNADIENTLAQNSKYRIKGFWSGDFGLVTK